MKMIKFIGLLFLIALQSHMYSSKLRQEPLGQGEVCKKSTKGFGPQKACKTGLKCKNPNKDKEVKGGAWKCLPDESKRRDEEVVKAGDICFKPTEEYNNVKKPCEPNYTCKKASMGVGGAWKCLKN